MVVLCTTVSQLFLFLSYLHTLSKLHSYHGKRYSLVIFSFLVGMISSCIGVTRFGNPLFEQQLSKPDQQLFILHRVLYPWMAAAELILLYWPINDHRLTFLFNIIMFTFPLVTCLWIFEIIVMDKKWKFETLKRKFAGPSLPICLTLAVSMLSSNFHGIVSAIVMILNTVYIGTSGSVFEVPVRDLFSFLQCSCNHHLVKALTD